MAASQMWQAGSGLLVKREGGGLSLERGRPIGEGRKRKSGRLCTWL